MIKLLVIIFDDERKIKAILRKYKLGFNAMTYGSGTAGYSLLRYFGLDEVRKSIYFSLIPCDMEENLFAYLKTKFKIKEVGKGVAFTISLLSSSKYLKDSLIKGEIGMNKNESLHELIVTIVKEGYSDQVMQAAKKAGCNGGTVIEGRSLGSSRTIFMDLAIEPEKDIVLTIVPCSISKKVMEEITVECGVKTDARGLILSLPIDNVVGLQEEI